MPRSAPGDVGSAANSYEILAKLAMGGMAEIFLAKSANNAGVERYVVLKSVLHHRADDARFVGMFLDEARLASQLQHPNIAQVYDIGKLGDSYFFTMEYVHGETVRALLQRTHGLRRQIPLSSVLSIVAGSAAGLHHAHERKGYDGKPLGIVHRDVSPSNLMISYEGTVKVVDFGVAKADHRRAETQAGTVKGKIAYMSPEQCKGGDVDRRSDLFSLGILMWEMLTTERLFRRASDFEVMQAIVSDEVPLPSTLRPDLPPEVDAIVMKLLARAPADRYQTADELNESIESVAVRTGSSLSTASLGRYMRELFGQRPEPWIELQSVEAHPEHFTVTSEPISSVGDFSISVADMIDVQSPISMVPLLVTADPDLAPTMQTPPAPQSNPYPVLSSASHGAYVSRVSAARLEAKRSKVPLIVMPALGLGAILGVALALGSSEKKTPTAHVTLPSPPDKPIVMATTPIDPPPVVVAPPIDAAPVAVVETPPDVAVLYKEHQYADVVTACNASKTTLAANASACTVAACKQREVSKARRWFASVTSKRANVQRECGTILPVEKRPTADDECKRDPLACQH